jgi:two-component system, cell cycle response regulator DivK
MMINPHEASVVVIEDHPDNLFIVMDLLREDIGVKYCNARASGQQLFKLLEGSPNLKIDLILLDIQIPYQDGYAVLKQIRTMAAFNATKVVALTANVMPQDVERARVEGFDGFIGKPINADRFPEQINRIFADEAVWEPR